jgi:2-polyprenyl-3-methyl-5-hydroxy-6-metoxy-1,4-benzoquinol methylase
MSTATPNYSAGNDRFGAEAATWDSQPEVVESSRLCLDAVLRHSDRFPSLSSSSVLEIGCGTGLLTVPLAQHVGSILALDTAQGMIDMLSAKLSSNALQHKVTAKVKLLESADDPVLEAKKFDVALSHLVFHHVPNMQQLVDVMFGTLNNGGRIWISDFEDDGPQAEAFHPKAKVRFHTPLVPADPKLTSLLLSTSTACRRGASWPQT